MASPEYMSDLGGSSARIASIQIVPDDVAQINGTNTIISQPISVKVTNGYFTTNILGCGWVTVNFLPPSAYVAPKRGYIPCDNGTYTLIQVFQNATNATYYGTNPPTFNIAASTNVLIVTSNGTAWISSTATGGGSGWTPSLLQSNNLNADTFKGWNPHPEMWL